MSLLSPGLQRGVPGCPGQEGRRNTETPSSHQSGGQEQLHLRSLPASSLNPYWTQGVDDQGSLSCLGQVEVWVQCFWAGLGFHESSPQELMSQILGTIPKEQLPTRNHTYHLV